MEKKYQVKFIDDDSIRRKINALRNLKLKLALRLQLQSGLRVKELAELRKEDLTFNEDGTIELYVRKGKGDKENKEKPRNVKVREDKYLFEKLKELTQKDPGGNRLFFTEYYIRHKAAEYGIETHDLRRINAQERVNDFIKQGLKRKEAKEIVKNELGHTNIKMTNIYLNRRKATSLLPKGRKVKKGES